MNVHRRDIHIKGSFDTVDETALPEQKGTARSEVPKGIDGVLIEESRVTASINSYRYDYRSEKQYTHVVLDHTL